MLLFPDATVRYINESGTQKSSTTVRTTRTTLRRLQNLYPRVPVDQFTTSQLTQFCLAGHPAPNTVRSRKALLKGFFDWCAYQKISKTNPATDLKFTVKTSTGGVRHHHWLSEQEVAHVLRSVPASGVSQRDRIALMAGFMMGLRREEISNLRWSQFSPDLSTLSLTGKGAKLATLGVPAQFQAELAAWRSKAPAGCDTVLPYVQRNWDSFKALWDRPIGLNGISWIVSTAVEASGIKFAPHDMRRSFAGILEEKGVPVTDISRLLRHSNVGITSTYLEKNPRKTAALGHGFTLEL